MIIIKYGTAGAAAGAASPPAEGHFAGTLAAGRTVDEAGSPAAVAGRRTVVVGIGIAVGRASSPRVWSSQLVTCE